MKKVGIVTFYDAINYGAFLQCFALQKVLNNDCNAKIIKYSNKKIANSYNLIKTKSIKKIIKSVFFLRKNYLKNKKFKNAIVENFQFGFLNENYDVVIAGSDQIWNIELTGGKDSVFSLEYFKNTKKISYASSIGKEELIKKYQNEYANIISNIDIVSVREESAKKELEKISNKEIKVNLDPTLLIPKEKWEKHTMPVEISEKYIFSYFVAVTQENYEALSDFSNMTNLKVLSYSENPKEKNILEECYTDGPFEFISKIKEAEYVFTSSFHGVVFSIIFNKQFICMLPKEKSNRITDLLEKLGLSDRCISTISDLKKLDYDKKINYEQVNEKLEEYRKDSINWLKKAIGE